jgi:hypothetical protein
MIQNFLADTNPPSDPSIAPTLPEPKPDRERVRIMVMGSPEGVNGIIYTLHRKQFAEVNDWSRPISTGVPGEVMRVLIRSIAARSH